MPFSRPTLTQNIQQIGADIASGVQNLLVLAVLRIVPKALAYLVQGLYGYLDWIALQCNPATATDPIVILAWGAIRGLTLNDAVAAQGTVQFSGTALADLPAGTQINRKSDGSSYLTNTDATVGNTGAVSVAITCTTPGTLGTLTPGDAMSLASSLVGISASSGTVLTSTAPGADIEDVLTGFKARMLAIWQAPPQGGDASDYIEWALEFPGVTRAWVKPGGAGAGTVVVYPMLDNTQSAHGGFPQGNNGISQYDNGSSPRAAVATGDQLAIADYICQGRYAIKGASQPVTALVYVCSPIPTNVALAFTGLAGAGATVQAAVTAAVAGVILRNAGPGGALDVNRNTVGTLNLVSIETAVAAATTLPFVLTVPAANIVMGPGQYPVPVITFA